MLRNPAELGVEFGARGDSMRRVGGQADRVDDAAPFGRFHRRQQDFAARGAMDRHVRSNLEMQPQRPA